MKFAVIGGGKMAHAMVFGIVKTGKLAPEDICVSGRHIEKLSDAMKKGIDRGEKSIYDWCCNRCIVTND